MSQQTVAVTIRLPVALAERVRERAGQDYRSVGSLIRKLIADGLEGQTGK